MARLDLDFSELEETVEDIAEEFDRLAAEGPGRTGRDPSGQFASAQEYIQSGIDRAMDQIAEEARQDAMDHVPATDAMTIRHRSGGWRNNRYSHEFFSTSKLVGYHEWGTGGRATDPSRGTVNDTTFDGRPGYRIEPNTEDVISYRDPSNPLADEDGYVYFEYVVHPGVKGKHFMRQALRRNSVNIRESVREELSRIRINV